MAIPGDSSHKKNRAIFMLDRVPPKGDLFSIIVLWRDNLSTIMLSFKFLPMFYFIFSSMCQWKTRQSREISCLFLGPVEMSVLPGGEGDNLMKEQLKDVPLETTTVLNRNQIIVSATVHMVDDG